jgi:anti-anti-sigma factor
MKQTNASNVVIRRQEQRKEAIMLRIITEHLADTTIVRPLGRIVAGREVESLKDAVAAEADKRLVVVDLAAVQAIDARGLGLLVFLQTLGYALGFELQLVNPTPRVREVLDLTRLDCVLEVSHPEAAGEPASEHAAA